MNSRPDIEIQHGNRNLVYWNPLWILKFKSKLGFFRWGPPKETFTIVWWPQVDIIHFVFASELRSQIFQFRYSVSISELIFKIFAIDLEFGWYLGSRPNMSVSRPNISVSQPDFDFRFRPSTNVCKDISRVSSLQLGFGGLFVMCDVMRLSSPFFPPCDSALPRLRISQRTPVL